MRLNSKTTARQGFRPNKRLGQHFLNDRNVIDNIIRCADLSPDGRVLEIGPGQGALTIPLARSVASVTAVEKDARLAEYLEKRCKETGISNVLIINEDILKLDFSYHAAPDRKLKIIGNLPYNISSPLLEKLFNHRDIISEAILMFQIEFAERIAAEPGCKQYGALTVMTQYNSSVTPLMKAPKEVFFPRPGVGSMVVKIDLEKPHPIQPKDEDIFKLVVRGSFSSRRKTIINSLKVIDNEFGRDQIIEALDKCDIDPKRRAETLSVDDFIRLADELSGTYCNMPQE